MRHRQVSRVMVVVAFDNTYNPCVACVACVDGVRAAVRGEWRAKKV